jgi:D-alanyl-D-alanine carboxypeptidase
MKSEHVDNHLQQVLNSSIDNKMVFGVSVRVEKGDASLVFLGSAGNLANDSLYFIASTTKLFITALTMRLRELGKLGLDDPIVKYLDNQYVDKLLIFKGVDYSDQITIRQLLSHTSGLPDYFQQKKKNRKSLHDELIAGHDQYWSIEQVINEVKNMKPQFKPGEQGKALYSDTNYQLLGKIIERITGSRIGMVLKEYIFDPLGLNYTYLYEDSKDNKPVPMFYKQKHLRIPLAMRSFGPDGGLVSNSKELMIFIKAFFQGKLFPINYFDEMKQWNRIFFPFEYGIGLARFQLPRIFSPFTSMPELLGHSGLSGVFAFYAPEKDVFLTGTVNQISNPGIPFRLMFQLLNCF